MSKSAFTYWTIQYQVGANVYVFHEGKEGGTFMTLKAAQDALPDAWENCNWAEAMWIERVDQRSLPGTKLTRVIMRPS